MSSTVANVDFLAVPMGRVDHPLVNFLFIGSKRDAYDIEELVAANVCFIVNCTRDHLEGGVKNFHEKEVGFRYFRVPLKDQETEVLFCYSLYIIEIGTQPVCPSRCLEVHDPRERHWG